MSNAHRGEAANLAGRGAAAADFDPFIRKAIEKFQYFQVLPIGLDFASRQPGNCTHRPRVRAFDA
jgi:hypothetical protein